jgi:hypothetical protein
MGRAYKCDRCGKFYDFTKCNDRVGIFIDYGPYGGDRKIDLCDDCYSELIKWLNSSNWIPEGLNLERCS